VVGTILNLINQGDRLFAAQKLDTVKLALTYCVPYLVSTYGAVSFRVYTARAERQRAAGREEEQHGYSRGGQPVRGDL
jgi:hypothetical protein